MACASTVQYPMATVVIQTLILTDILKI